MGAKLAFAHHILTNFPFFSLGCKEEIKLEGLLVTVRFELSRLSIIKHENTIGYLRDPVERTQLFCFAGNHDAFVLLVVFKSFVSYKCR